ncbi:MAG: hypothetical protein J5506_05860 [Prevotella sp.]|nr:hypothetical protein [Prevotella sp.]
MENYFICLANSYKRGGRCVAGIEVSKNECGEWTVVRNQDGTPHWIRPVSYAAYGEIFNYEAKNISLFSIVKITDMSPCPIKAHAENVHYKRMECLGRIALTADFLNQLTDRIHKTVFYNYERTIPLDTFNSGNYSLMFIRPQKAHVYVDNRWEKPKYRMRVLHLGNYYDMPITDPAYLQELEQHPENTGELNDIYLTLSLGLEYQNQHHKLIAGVFFENQILTPTSTAKPYSQANYQEYAKETQGKPYPSPEEIESILRKNDSGKAREEVHHVTNTESETKESRQGLSLMDRVKSFFKRKKEKTK